MPVYACVYMYSKLYLRAGKRHRKIEMFAPRNGVTFGLGMTVVGIAMRVYVRERKMAQNFVEPHHSYPE